MARRCIMESFERSLDYHLVEEDSFISAHKRLLKLCVVNEMQVPFGDVKNPKTLQAEICSMTVLKGKAIEQVLDGINYLSQFDYVPLKEQALQGYVNEYLLSYIEEQRRLPADDPRKFVYNYYDRLRFYPCRDGKTLDQVEAVRKSIAEQIKNNHSSNRNQMVTWIAEEDISSGSPPCLQIVWVPYMGNHQIEVHLHWRSRDLYGAWLANLVAIINMIQRDIAEPNNCKIVKIVDIVDSNHIYSGDFAAAKKVVF